MKKKIKYYSIATICSIAFDAMFFYVYCSGIKEHSDIFNVIMGTFLVVSSILLNCSIFLVAKELLKPKNICLITRLPGVVHNDEFEFPKLDLETGKLK